MRKAHLLPIVLVLPSKKTVVFQNRLKNVEMDIKHGIKVANLYFCKHVFSFVLVYCYELGDNCIQIFHLGRYIVGYTVGNFVLRRRVSGAVKHDFRPYIRRYTTPNEKFEYCYPHSNVLFSYRHRKNALFFLRNVSVTSDEKHDVNQSQVTLLMTLGFRRYIAEYTVARF